MGETIYAFESNPELLWASLIGAAATIALFRLFRRQREMRGRLMPLCALTLLHTLVFPLACCFPLHSEYTERTFSDTVAVSLGIVHLLSTPVLFSFLLIYTIVLVVSARMNRFVALAAGIFLLNVLIQAFFALYAYGAMFTR